MSKLKYQVWVLIGDGYELRSYGTGTPCRTKEDGLCYLGDLREKNYKGDFDLHVRDENWTKACLTEEKNLRGTFEIRGDFEDLDKREVAEVLHAAVNSEDCKTALENLGIKKPKVWPVLY